MNNETKNEIKRCSTCKKEKNIEHFLKGNKVLKRCIRCREIDRKNKNKNKCEHGRQRNNCKDCGGSSICIHNKRRQICKGCGGSSICIHNKIRSACKICKDEKKITIENMISQSKQNDKKKNLDWFYSMIYSLN